jgi:hypothetical protein
LSADFREVCQNNFGSGQVSVGQLKKFWSRVGRRSDCPSIFARMGSPAINASGSENVIFEGTMVADELIGMGKDARFLDERWEVKPIWLDVDKETAKSRRTSRTDYEVADPPGYFDEKVWPLCCVKKKMAQEKRILLLHQHEKVNLKKVIHDFFN